MTIETDPSKVRPETHTFIGMFRPPWTEFGDNIRGTAVLVCASCGKHHVQLGPVKDCWLAGHFDIPQYRLIEEPKAEPGPDNPIFSQPTEGPFVVEAEVIHWEKEAAFPTYGKANAFCMSHNGNTIKWRRIVNNGRVVIMFRPSPQHGEYELISPEMH